MIQVFVVLFFFSLLLGSVFTSLMINASRRFEFMDQPGARKAHSAPIPLGGGIALYLGFALVIAAGVIAALIIEMGWASPPAWAPAFVKTSSSGIVFKAVPLFILLIGGTVIFVLGIVDDLRGLSAGMKLSVETAVALAMYYALPELKVTFFVNVPWLWPIFTVCWIVGVTNAFNFLDNMDGLCAGLAIVTSWVFFVLALQTVPQQQFIAAILIVFIGILCGFLIFNFPPARIFLGDAGSLFIGYVLAVLTILFTFYQSKTRMISPLFVLIVPLQILAIPIFDLAMVVWIRLRTRKPIYQGDRNHISHRLVALGMSQRESVLCILLIALFIGFSTTLALQIDSLGMGIILMMTLVLLTIVTMLEQAGRRRE